MFCGEIRKILCGYPLLSVAMSTGNHVVLTSVIKTCTSRVMAKKHLTAYSVQSVHGLWLQPTNITGLVKCTTFAFVCIEALRPNQPNGVISSAVNLPHTFTGQALVTSVPNFVKLFFDIKRLGTTYMLYDRLHAWLFTQSRLITLLPSLLARRRVRPQIL